MPMLIRFDAGGMERFEFLLSTVPGFVFQVNSASREPGNETQQFQDLFYFQTDEGRERCSASEENCLYCFVETWSSARMRIPFPAR